MKETAAALILISFIALNMVCILSVKAQPYQGGITISADGSVSPSTPSTAPIQQEGDTYTLTSDVEGSIWLGRNDTVLDGNGYTITDGIRLHGVSNDTVKNFVITGGTFGIAFSGTSCVIANNTITGTGNGIMSMVNPTAAIGVTGDSNIIIGNNLANNYVGIDFFEGDNNTVVGNTIENTRSPYVGVAAIEFWDSSYNTIYHNNFVNNSRQADDSLGCVWDAGYPLGGNYWSDYLTRYPNASEIDSSGIGDTPYRIRLDNVDRYPLMEPFNSTFGALQTTPPRISLVSPLNQTYHDSNVSLIFSVNVLSPIKSVNWTGYSLDGKRNVTVTGNTTLTGLSSGVHNVTVYANDTYGNMAASETIDFTIPKPFPIVPVAAVSVAVAVAVATATGLLVYFKKRNQKKTEKSK
jgi:parallel beta-helix repeat protein